MKYWMLTDGNYPDREVFHKALEVFRQHGMVAS